MTQSPKKYVSAYTSSTANRGVEAKEVEIGNIQLDMSSQYQESTDVERSQASAETGSYLQVVVQKHRKKEPTATATQTSPRLPTSSSPLKPIRNGSGDQALYVLSHPMLVYNTQEKPERHERRKLPTLKEESKKSFWSKFKITDNTPDKVDLYYFEKCNGEFLATSDGTYTYTEKIALQMSRIPKRLVAEIFSVPQIMASIPVALFLSLERSILITLRSLLVGSVQMWSDYFFKPVLTLVFNAVLQPPIIFVGNVGRSVRDAVRPLAEIFGVFLEPVVKVLGSTRLVNIEKSCSHNV